MNSEVSQKVILFLEQYDTEIIEQAMTLRKLILKLLPGIQEEVDLSARMIAFTYGPKYQDMICTIIPSKKGLKLGFYKGNELTDPEGILHGTGKISRYVQIDKGSEIQMDAITGLIKSAKTAYKLRKNI